MRQQMKFPEDWVYVSEGWEQLLRPASDFVYMPDDPMPMSGFVPDEPLYRAPMFKCPRCGDPDHWPHGQRVSCQCGLVIQRMGDVVLVTEVLDDSMLLDGGQP